MQRPWGAIRCCWCARQISRCLEGNLPLAVAAQMLEHWEGRWWTVGNLARLRGTGRRPRLRCRLRGRGIGRSWATGTGPGRRARRGQPRRSGLPAAALVGTGGSARGRGVARRFRSSSWPSTRGWARSAWRNIRIYCYRRCRPPRKRAICRRRNSSSVPGACSLATCF